MVEAKAKLIMEVVFQTSGIYDSLVAFVLILVGGKISAEFKTTKHVSPRIIDPDRLIFKMKREVNKGGFKLLRNRACLLAVLSVLPASLVLIINKTVAKGKCRNKAQVERG